MSNVDFSQLISSICFMLLPLLCLYADFYLIFSVFVGTPSLYTVCQKKNPDVNE